MEFRWSDRIALYQARSALVAVNYERPIQGKGALEVLRVLRRSVPGGTSAGFQDCGGWTQLLSGFVWDSLDLNPQETIHEI